ETPTPAAHSARPRRSRPDPDLSRYIRNRRLIDALHAQALSALSVSPGARGYYDDLRARETGHADALRRAASRLTGILHGCRGGCVTVALSWRAAVTSSCCLAP
ncbi:MAG: hypothetical protein ACREPI_13585, partial [Candidatus Dormibacterales bacterium]